MSQLTVVMYHYVRDLERSRYPGIKGLSVQRFRGQLAWLKRHHTFVRVEDVLAAARGDGTLPGRAVLLTFDDGYSDHYRYVTPILDDLRVQGCFFPPLLPLRDRALLDVNRIHFTLAAAPSVSDVASFCLERIDELREAHGLQPARYYEQAGDRRSRFDDGPTLMVKRLLQRELPAAVRSQIAGEAFARFVSVDERAFAEELYLTSDQIGTMRRLGMWFGAHGVTHRWLDSLSREDQEEELLGSLAWLQEIGFGPGDWTVAYPYGGFDETTLAVTRDLGFSLGFTVETRTARVGQDDSLRLPRVDTVDLPFDPDAEVPATARA